MAAASVRDIRLDLFRGLALWFIFLDHIPTNIVSWLTVRNYGFSDATEIFVFISGYTAVIAYSRMLDAEGWPRTAARIYRRVWQLYVAHILLFMAFSAQIAWVSIARDPPALIEEMELLGLGSSGRSISTCCRFTSSSWRPFRSSCRWWCDGPGS